MGKKGPTQDGKPRRISIAARRSKVTVEDFASLPEGFAWLTELEKMIPSILAGRDMAELASRVARASRDGRPVLVMTGAHVVKCGLGPLIAELIRRDLPYYDPKITPEFVAGMNTFARSMGILNDDVPYERVVATQFAELWQ